jgi:hypothetical protein
MAYLLGDGKPQGFSLYHCISKHTHDDVIARKRSRPTMVTAMVLDDERSFGDRLIRWVGDAQPPGAVDREAALLPRNERARTRIAQR